MKKIIAVVLACLMLFAVPLNVLAAMDIEQIDMVREASVYDIDGNLITSRSYITFNGCVVEIYVNGQLHDRATTNSSTNKIHVEMFDREGTTEVLEYDLSEYCAYVDEFGDEGSVSTNAAYTPTSSFTINGRVRTDYRYQNEILYGDTNTRFYEPSQATRHSVGQLNFSRGDLAAVVISAAMAILNCTLSIMFIVDQGVPIVAEKINDGFKKTVCYTTARVQTRVYFDGVYTAYITRDFNKTILLRDAETSAISLSTDYYGYDIVTSTASSAVSGSVLAFSDKYITCIRPNLALPITSIPYVTPVE